VINNERVNFSHNKNIIEIKDSDRLITEPQQIVDMFNTFYIGTAEDLKSSNTPRNSKSYVQHRLTYNQNTMFISPCYGARGYKCDK
jgi:hypothetical protein